MLPHFFRGRKPVTVLGLGGITWEEMMERPDMESASYAMREAMALLQAECCNRCLGSLGTVVSNQQSIPSQFLEQPASTAVHKGQTSLSVVWVYEEGMYPAHTLFLSFNVRVYDEGMYSHVCVTDRQVKIATKGSNHGNFARCLGPYRCPWLLHHLSSHQVPWIHIRTKVGEKLRGHFS